MELGGSGDEYKEMLAASCSDMQNMFEVQMESLRESITGTDREQHKEENDGAPFATKSLAFKIDGIELRTVKPAQNNEISKPMQRLIAKADNAEEEQVAGKLSQGSIIVEAEV